MNSRNSGINSSRHSRSSVGRAEILLGHLQNYPLGTHRNQINKKEKLLDLLIHFIHVLFYIFLMYTFINIFIHNPTMAL